MIFDMKTIRLYSWNVNGLRAAERKGFLDWLHGEKPDILGLQETKALPEQLSDSLLHPEGYEAYWNSAERKGYSGTAVYTKISPMMTVIDFGEHLLDEEGRIILLEFDQFYFFNVYFPNGGRGSEYVDRKLRFYDQFLDVMQTFRKKKPIVLSGDVNTAHREIDLARPKANRKYSGFLLEECAWLDKIVDHGYVDTFRLHTAEGGHYTWWDQVTRSRERNVGWRLDYFFVSEELKKHVKAATIHADVMGSDHCPVSVMLEF